jgi:hypothetical protein
MVGAGLRVGTGQAKVLRIEPRTHYRLKILVAVPAPGRTQVLRHHSGVESFDQIILCSKGYMCATAQTIPLWSPTLLSQQRVLNKEIDGSAESCVAITGLGRRCL